jgi:hypothetical protein
MRYIYVQITGRVKNPQYSTVTECTGVFSEDKPSKYGISVHCDKGQLLLHTSLHTTVELLKQGYSVIITYSDCIFINGLGTFSVTMTRYLELNTIG